MPKEIFSVHWIKNINFKNAINNYLDEEIKIIEKQRKELEQFSPFKKN